MEDLKNTDVGIGILDIYSDASLKRCIESVIRSDAAQSPSYIISNKKIKTSDVEFNKHITHQVSMAALRNHCVAHFRSMGVKYIFLLNSNVTITDPDFVKNTIKTAETFGTWFLTGNNETPTILDDDSGQSLEINNKLNTDFVFIRSGVAGTLGYFDERYVNTKDLDVLDYINTARKNGMYPKHPFHTTVGRVATYEKEKIERIDHSDTLDVENRSVGFSYGYFKHRWNYIPDMEETETISKEDLMVFMGDLQKNYGKS